VRTPHDNALLLLLALVTVAFAWILAPFYGAVLWGAVFAILLTPIYRWLLRKVRNRHGLAGGATLLLVLLGLIFPLMFLMSALTQEATRLYQMVQSGELNPTGFLRNLFESLPPWLHETLERQGFADFDAVQLQLSAAVRRLSQIVAWHLLNLGQNMLSFFVGLFVMLYLLYFFLKDGSRIADAITRAVPMREDRLHALVDRFAIVVRATMKSNLAVAGLQGSLGALIFFLLGIRSPLLWGALMAVLSLLPLVGAILVWLPAALYLMSIGSTGKGLVLLLYGVFVIGLVDNVVRPLIVGKDTSLPDYVVLVSTLGGLALLGVNGFIVGPLIASMFVAAWDIYASDSRAPRTELDHGLRRSRTGGR
jgi:predicted PurR-regulated permease PerM